MFKYLCELQSGRDFVLTSDIKDDDERSEVLAWTAIEESKLMDDYLVNVKRID
jgi:hypothetical protein